MISTTIPPTYTITWTAAMTLDASGNLGISQTPNAWGAGYNALQTKGGSFYSSTSGNVVVGQNYYHDGTNFRYITSNPATYYLQSGGTHAWGYGASGTAGATLTFTEAARIDTSGNLLLGGATAAWPPAQGIALLPSSSAGIGMSHASGTASGAGYMIFAYNGTGIGSITQSGTTAVLYNTTSDARLKENIAPAEDAGSVIDAIDVRQYDWISDKSHQRYGFVAQELTRVYPEAVHQPQSEDDMMAVDYSKLVPVLVKELQSLRARVASLESA